MPTARCAPPPAGSGTPTTAGDRAGMPRTGQGARIADSVPANRRAGGLCAVHRTSGSGSRHRARCALLAAFPCVVAETERGQGAIDVESHCQAAFASRMMVTAAWGSGTVIVTLRPVCRASRRAGPVRTVK